MESTINEAEPMLISALNDYVFCPRRCALHHIEGWWDDNEHTAAGLLLHDHTDEPGYETDADVTLLRALPLFSARYGLTGKADIVEVRNICSVVTRYRFESADKSVDSKILYAPVEYKKGRRRKWENDDVQLCAQAFCLEEMFSVVVPEGFIYHATSKRRRKVIFDERLRAETEQAIDAVRNLLAKAEVPPAVLLPRCDGCSLRSICLPELTQITAQKELDQYGKNLWI